MSRLNKNGGFFPLLVEVYCPRTQELVSDNDWELCLTLDEREKDTARGDRTVDKFCASYLGHKQSAKPFLPE